jgi:nucleotide-binding universal stress UspA family protein
MNILVAIEESTHSDKALAYAVETAKTTGSRLTALSIGEVIDDLDGMHQVSEINDVFMAKARATADKATKFAKAQGIDIDVIVRPGPSPADCILDYERQNNIDMVILGARAKKRLEKYLIGSVAYRVVRHADCSVVVVR